MVRVTFKGSKHPAYKHGMDGTPTYRAWVNMKGRCLNSNYRAYPDYGGRGIKVCNRWMEFGNFLQDMGVCPPNLTLERIDNDGSYEPSNCRWITQAEQTRNRRTTVLNWDTVDYIRASPLTSTTLETELSIASSSIRRIRRGERWVR